MNNEIALYPWSQSNLKNLIFDRENVYNIFRDSNNYSRSNLFRYLKDELLHLGYNFNTIDMISDLNKVSYIFFFDVPEENNPYYKKCLEMNLNSKMVLFLWEPSAVNSRNYILSHHENFKYVFTWNDDLVNNIKYFKFYYPNPNFNEIKLLDLPLEKNLCTLIAGNKKSHEVGELYSERLKLIEFCEKNKYIDFDFYGRGWNKGLRKFFSKYRNYKGETNDKLVTLSNYTFTICYENQRNLNGYITEKIIDCFYASSIPIYWGAPNICKYIPKNCFIDRRDFKNEKDLFEYIKSLKELEISEYQKNIRDFLKSEKYIFFTDIYFNANIIRVLELKSII